MIVKVQDRVRGSAGSAMTKEEFSSIFEDIQNAMMKVQL
jgi:hypothetical protein